MINYRIKIQMILIIGTILVSTPVSAATYTQYVAQVDTCIGEKNIFQFTATTLDCLAANAKDFSTMRLEDVAEILEPVKDLITSSNNSAIDEVFLTDGSVTTVSTDILYTFIAPLDNLLLLSASQGPWESFGDFQPNPNGGWDVLFDTSSLDPNTTYQIAYSFASDPTLLNPNNDNFSPFGISTLVTAVPEPSTIILLILSIIGLNFSTQKIRIN